MASLGPSFRNLRLGLGIGVAGLVTLVATAPAMAGFVLIKENGFSLQVSHQPIQLQVPRYNYARPHTIPFSLPSYHYSYSVGLPFVPVSSSITINTQGTTVILPLNGVNFYNPSLYQYYGF
jgi:hypothetical protein